jgi:sugar phosphate isomerase/epimerase
VGEVLSSLRARGFNGDVIAEVSTRKSVDRQERETDLAEALAFARWHLDSASGVGGSGDGQL